MLIILLLFFFNSKPFQYLSTKSQDQKSSNRPIIVYGITPTYTRLTQKADLTRLSQTLRLVESFYWIVVEDSYKKTNLVKNLLYESGLNYTHLHVKARDAPKDSTAKAVEPRNLALDWLREHLRNIDDPRGVVYFMEDENTYGLKIFEEMRKINKVGTWPVGIVDGMRVELPLVQTGKVIGFNAVWNTSRPFPIDMAGFAINTTLILERPKAKFSWRVKCGHEESEILKQFLITREDLEPLAEDCTKVYVWHTRTAIPHIITPKELRDPPAYEDYIEV